MSVAAPVAAGKSEKAKKFQSLNINTLYQVRKHSLVLSSSSDIFFHLR